MCIKMDQRNDNILKMKTSLSHITNEINRKKLIIEKWERNLARKREKSNSSLSESRSKERHSNGDSDNNKDITEDEPIHSNKSLNSPPHTFQTSLAIIDEEVDNLVLRDLQDVHTNDVLLMGDLEDEKRRSSRIKKMCKGESNSLKKPSRRRRIDVSFPPFPNDLRDVNQSFSLPEQEFPSSKEIISTDSDGTRQLHCPSPPLFEDCFDHHDEAVTAASVTPIWTVKSPIEEPVEVVHLWTNEHVSILLACQKSRITVWKKNESENDWISLKSHPLRINKDHVYRFDVVYMKDKIGVLFATKFNTTVRISLHPCFPTQGSTEKITKVAENTHQILGCRCGDQLIVYAFVNDYCTAPEIWRLDSRLSRLIRGREVAVIDQTIHSLCPLINTSGKFFIGIAPVTVYIWNAHVGSLLITVDLDESFISVKSCGFASFEKGFLFLGVVNVTVQADVQLVVINPKTGKWQRVVTWEESTAEDMSISLNGFPVAELITIVCGRRICLRDVANGSLVAKATLCPASASTLTSLHPTYPSHTHVYTLAVGNAAGTVTIYCLYV